MLSHTNVSLARELITLNLISLPVRGPLYCKLKQCTAMVHHEFSIAERFAHEVVSSIFQPIFEVLELHGENVDHSVRIGRFSRQFKRVTSKRSREARKKGTSLGALYDKGWWSVTESY